MKMLVLGVLIETLSACSCVSKQFWRRIHNLNTIT